MFIIIVSIMDFTLDVFFCLFSFILKLYHPSAHCSSIYNDVPLGCWLNRSGGLPYKIFLTPSGNIPTPRLYRSTIIYSNHIFRLFLCSTGYILRFFPFFCATDVILLVIDLTLSHFSCHVFHVCLTKFISFQFYLFLNDCFIMYRW